MLEVGIACAAFTLLSVLPPTERQKQRARHGWAGRSLREKIVALRRAGMIHRR